MRHKTQAEIRARKEEIHQKNVQVLKDLKAGTLKQNFNKGITEKSQCKEVKNGQNWKKIKTRPKDSQERHDRKVQLVYKVAE